MKLILRAIGKAHDANLKETIELYTKRISHYYPVEWQLIAAPKEIADPELSRKKEGELIIKHIKKDEFFVLLDERGKQLKSEKFAENLEKWALEGKKEVSFLIGGAYGVSDEVKNRSNFIWSLSELVFPHQLVRAILAEQIYRACTIIRNESYHHS